MSQLFQQRLSGRLTQRLHLRFQRGTIFVDRKEQRLLRTVPVHRLRARQRAHCIVGLTACGIGVYGTTGRLEKCYRAFAAELESEYTVVEAGMQRPKVKDEDFVGKDAHLRHREEEPAAILCTLTVDDHTSASGVKRYPLGREPITLRDGTPLTDAKGRRSYVTSAGAGPSLGRYILMAYLPPEHAVEGSTDLAVEYMHERFPVTVDVVGSRPIFDPENTRIRS